LVNYFIRVNMTLFRPKEMDYQKQLNDVQLTAGLLREFLHKGLHSASIKAIDEQLKLIGQQARVLRKIKKELINES
jgi:hypothetical protein